MNKQAETADEFDQIQNMQERNARILSAIDDSPNGEIKSASAAGTNMIRRRIREEGFLRRIIPPQTVTNDDLNRVLEHDKPVIIEDMEPGQRGSKSIPFGDAADTEFYYGNKYAVYFNPITTPEFTKDINELRTYRMDLRQVVTDNSLKDIETEEDTQFINTVNAITGPSNGVGATGVQQNFVLTGGFERDTFVDVLNGLENVYLNNGVLLMNRKTAKGFLKWGRDEVGGDLAEKLMTDGLSALVEAKMFGVKMIFTIKRNLVPDNVVYAFAEPAYLGKFYELQQTCMFIEKKKDILRVSARETIGVSIANVAGCQQFSFVP
jgi:hypothetical protein